MSTLQDVRAVFADAKAKHEAAQSAKRAMESLVLNAFQQLMPTDFILDLRFSKDNPPAAHLGRVRTMRGNDRGTEIFRVVKVVAVDADPMNPSLSTWIADAVPVSEKTGKDMKASSGHVSGQATVRLHGNVGCEYGLDEPVEAAEERVLNLVAQHCAVANA